MPLPQVIDLISNLDLMSESINTWKNGVERALKLFIPDGTPLASRKCPECGDPEGLIYEEGCVKCKSCLMSRCG
jgi:ribonucleoside-diphosphate reductase alpha chain